MDNDAVMDALEKLKDWAMERMLASGEAPDGDVGEKPPEKASEPEAVAAEIEIDAMPMDDMHEDEEDEEEKPKNTVISRHFVGGGLPKKSGKIPVSRR